MISTRSECLMLCCCLSQVSDAIREYRTKGIRPVFASSKFRCPKRATSKGILVLLLCRPSVHVEAHRELHPTEIRPVQFF